MNLMLIILHNVLKSLPLYKYYEELHNAIDTYNDQKLDVDCDYCTSNQESKSDEGSKLIKLCTGICGIIQDFDNFKKNCKQIPDEKLCPYINYWLLDYALTISNVNTHIDRFYSALAIISISRRNLWKKCSFKKYTLKKSIFDKKKILYEFTEIYDHIKEEFSHENNSNVKTYCKHIKENFRYFNSINEECINQNSCDYYDEYKKFKEKFNNPEVLNLIYKKCNYTKTSCEQGSNAEDNYFDYKCYKRLKDYYDKYYVSEDGMKYLDEYKNSPGDIKNIISNYYDIFKKLTNNLSGSGLMYYHKSITCMYNNYWLNKEIRKKSYNENKNTKSFEVLKKYAHEYSNKVYGSYKNSCEDYIHYIDSDKYEKMSKLYELYDMYNYHKSPHSNITHSDCDTLGHLIRIHDQIINYHEDEEYPKKIDKDLYKRRMEMKDLIKKFKLKLDDSCISFKTFKIHTSKYEKEELEKERAAQRQQEEQRLEEARRVEQAQHLEQAKKQASLSSSDTIDSDSRQTAVYPQKEKMLIQYL
ncbi:hypothetical protein PVNG_03101 [Plasmodium vivax North Korean]|uniref:Uncharacterized protein n=1 Tax=Plasmodium vivax North Korean TaxID=1035514 RepID=A0A0J9WEP0_PLAVI|nr:hypothetical protein PVNG_03101 [Plasmodium vivax North Korean]